MLAHCLCERPSALYAGAHSSVGQGPSRQRWADSDHLAPVPDAADPVEGAVNAGAVVTAKAANLR